MPVALGLILLFLKSMASFTLTSMTEALWSCSQCWPVVCGCTSPRWSEGRRCPFPGTFSAVTHREWCLVADTTAQAGSTLTSQASQSINLKHRVTFAWQYKFKKSCDFPFLLPHSYGAFLRIWIQNPDCSCNVYSQIGSLTQFTSLPWKQSIESLRLEKPSETIKSNLWPIPTLPPSPEHWVLRPVFP